MADKIGNNFNEKSGGPDANREARRKRASMALIGYGKADTELKEKMEEIMSGIDRDPASFDAIMAYGTEPLENLRKVAHEVVAIESKFTEQVKVMNVAMDNVNR